MKARPCVGISDCLAILMLACLVSATTALANGDAVASAVQDEDGDDTPDVETETTLDEAEEETGWNIDGDLRPIYDYFDLEGRDGGSESADTLGGRARLAAEWGATKRLHFGARLAGRCFTDNCPVEFVTDSAIPGPNGLQGGQFTLDQLYLHWFKRNRFDIALGRLQTRFLIRGGIFARSLDRNDSANVNVTWTDGIHGTYRGPRGWVGHFVLQRNARDGTGSVRRSPLDFDDGGARNTYFVAFESIRSWGPVVQRAFDVSYLPSSLLKDGDPDGRREDYWGVVGRLALRWPQRSEGPRLRAGIEVGYAAETPTEAAVDLGADGDADGTALDLVVSVMDFAPGHNIGLNYARTEAGWLLSPQARPNDELIEVRYQWRPKRFPLVEARLRHREELDQLVGTVRKRNVLDFFLRLTWRFVIKD